jgi:prolyl-tRNA synthetase
VGARDVASGSVPCKPRVPLVPATKLSLHDGSAATTVQGLLGDMQAALLAAARARLAANTHRVSRYADLRDAAAAQQHDDSPAGGAASSHSSSASAALAPAPMFLAPWAEDAEAEARVKAETRYTIRCYPAEGQEQAKGAACFLTGRPATHIALFARAY